MGTDAFINGMSPSAGSSDGKVIAAMPDVCFTPPQAPPTPPGVPIPYPNTAMASDLTDGSTTVKIAGKPAHLKDKSSFKKSSGDEAGSAGTKGLVSTTNTGAVYAASWSMDVKIEGENVVRHLDLTTANHSAAQPGNAPPFPFIESMSPAVLKIEECADNVKEVEKKCATSKPPQCTPDCAKAQRCVLAPKNKTKAACCAPDRTGHHLIEVHCFSPVNARGSPLEAAFANYDQDKAPCVCASTYLTEGQTHRTLHAVQGRFESAFNRARETPLPTNWGPGNYSKWNYGEARTAGVTAHAKAFPNCDSACIAKQLDAYHKDDPAGPQVTDETPMRTDPGARGKMLDSIDGQMAAKIDADVRSAVESEAGIASGVGAGA